MAEAGNKEVNKVLGYWQTFKIPIILGSISLLLIIVALVLLVKSFQATNPIQFSSDAATASVASKEVITVDVQGAVVSPGVYRVPQGSRVETALVAAGGLTEEADLERIAKVINRAARLSDGAKLYLWRKDDSPQPQGSTSNLVGGVAAVSVNEGSQAQLEALAGIGPVTAQKIISNRPFQTLGELVTKKLMSRSLFEKLKDQLTL